MFSPPRPLTPDIELKDFSCGRRSLDLWLRDRALANQAGGAARTYVVLGDAGLVGYYSLAAGSIDVIDSPGRLRRNMPIPIPVVLFGRLAVDQRFQGSGLGSGMLKDGIQRVSQAAEIIGIHGVIVHALVEAAKAFYVGYGFVALPTQPMTLVYSLHRQGP